jgi:hypothetical protein
MTNRMYKLLGDALMHAADGFAVEIQRGQLVHTTPDGWRTYRRATDTLVLVSRESTLTVTVVGVDLDKLT